MPVEKEEERIYQIALSQIPGVGNQTARKLIAHFGTINELFSKKYQQLLKVPDIGPVLAKTISQKSYLKSAEKIFQDSMKNDLKIFFFLDENYPERLKSCIDSPIIIYAKGENLNFSPRSIAIVGTRKSTDYGERITNELLVYSQNQNINFISGFAYGIDITMHKICNEMNLPNFAIMAGGLDHVYPYSHKKYLDKIIELGGILSEHPWGTKPDPRFFPMRNRIIAGMSDLVVVIEAASKGGALITADIANSYNREVFAVPGDLNKTYSEGCNKLIFENKAALYLNPIKMFEWMNWDLGLEPHKKKTLEINFNGLDSNQIEIMRYLMEKKEDALENISTNLGIKISQIFALIIQLEILGYLKLLPGNKCRLI